MESGENSIFKSTAFKNPVINNPDTVKQFKTPPGEIEGIKQFEALLGTDVHPKFVGVDGEAIALPESLYHTLKAIVQAMAAGKTISIIPTDEELSTQDAADLLNVSRPYLIKLLEQGQIPFTTVGTHRRIKFQDVQDYKRVRDASRRQSLQQMTEMLQEEGFYNIERR
jgi:excisionase family DNA binding protein